MADDKRAYAPDSDLSLVRQPYFPVEEIEIDYEASNFARKACYKTPDGEHACTFHPARVHDLLPSILVSGQLQPVRVYLDGTKRPRACHGFRRLYCFQLLKWVADGGPVGRIDGIDGSIDEQGESRKAKNIGERRLYVQDLLESLAASRSGDQEKAESIFGEKGPREDARLLVAIRAFADLGLEVIPNSRKGKVFCVKAETPKSPEAYLEIALGNVDENIQSPPNTLDIAFLARRLVLSPPNGEFGMSYREAGIYLGRLLRGHPVGVGAVKKWVQASKLPPKYWGKLASGELTRDEALRRASREGDGSGRGQRTGVKKPVVKKALSDGQIKEWAQLHLDRSGEFTVSDIEETVEFLFGLRVKPPRWLEGRFQ